jgi:hypothetical protein
LLQRVNRTKTEFQLRIAPHVAPRRAGAKNPENAVDRAPLAIDRWIAFSPIGEQWIENAPLLVSQIAPTQSPRSGDEVLRGVASLPGWHGGLCHGALLGM